MEAAALWARATDFPEFGYEGDLEVLYQAYRQAVATREYVARGH